MSTLIFIVSCVVLGVMVLSKVPGLEHFVRPIISMMFTMVEASLKNLWAWGIYVVKTLFFSHIDLARHLLLSAEQIDPSYNMREQYEKS